jgi:hypothetical protein
MTESTDGTASARLASALMECLAPVTQILDHMARAPTAPDIESAVATLTTALEGVLAPFEARYQASELERAAEIVDEVTDAILEEIMLVPHAPPRRPGSATRRPNGKANRRSRRR